MLNDTGKGWAAEINWKGRGAPCVVVLRKRLLVTVYVAVLKTKSQWHLRWYGWTGMDGWFSCCTVTCVVRPWVDDVAAWELKEFHNGDLLYSFVWWMMRPWARVQCFHIFLHMSLLLVTKSYHAARTHMLNFSIDRFTHARRLGNIQSLMMCRPVPSKNSQLVDVKR
jgi:hypothetical protein